MTLLASFQTCSMSRSDYKIFFLSRPSPCQWYIHSCRVFFRRLATLQVRPWAVIVQDVAQERHLKGGNCHVNIPVRALCQTTGQLYQPCHWRVTLDRKIGKFLTCSTSGRDTGGGGCPKRNITTSCPFVIPDVNNRCRGYEFVSHNQIVW